MIALNDLLIIAEALSPDCVLVTDDERALSRIAGLALENWRRRSGRARPSMGIDRARVQRHDHIV
ncbi:MAG: hypothetical protein ACR2QH_12955 [Geminicoccaceae bacterium]